MGTAVMCRNDRLNAYLEQLATSGHDFDSAWLYREELSPHREAHQYVIFFQRREARETRLGASPKHAGCYLRLDWGRDGLSFMEMGSKLPDELLLRSKVFEPVLRPNELLQSLQPLETLCFHVDYWNSSCFCHHLLEQGSGLDDEYR